MKFINTLREGERLSGIYLCKPENQMRQKIRTETREGNEK